ncbi:hypothetical protein Droror1_Dr00000898 [Drosera rotundifolia]
MCTVEKRGNVFILTLTGDSSSSDLQHRLNPTLIASLRSALSSIRSSSFSSSASSPVSALVTVAEGNFFSNGFDLAWASQSPNPKSRLSHMVRLFKPLIADLISLPMPTVAAVTGHAAAAGMVLAMAHDYVVMRKDRGVLYMSELDLGLPFPEYFTVMFREKVGSVQGRREMLLRARKVRAEEAVGYGVVDEAWEGRDRVVEAAVGMAEALGEKGWNGGVYAEIRKSLYPGLCRELGLSSAAIDASAQDALVVSTVDAMPIAKL